MATMGCTQEQRNETNEEVRELKEEMRVEKKLDPATLDYADHGGEPYVAHIEDLTEANTTFRTAVWTGSNLQLTVMSIPVGGDVGKEIHNDVEQFLRLEEGEGEVFFGQSEDTMTSYGKVKSGDCIIVPKATWHNIKNIGDEPMKLYSIYSPTEHPRGTVHQTMAEGQHHE